MPHCGRSFTTSRVRTLSRKTVVNSLTDTNPEKFAVKEWQKDRRLIPDQEHGINV